MTGFARCWFLSSEMRLSSTLIHLCLGRGNLSALCVVTKRLGSSLSTTILLHGSVSSALRYAGASVFANGCCDGTVHSGFTSLPLPTLKNPPLVQFFVPSPILWVRPSRLISHSQPS